MENLDLYLKLGELDSHPNVMVMTPDSKIYTIKEVVHEEPEDENPTDPYGTIWLKVEEF